MKRNKYLNILFIILIFITLTGCNLFDKAEDDNTAVNKNYNDTEQSNLPESIDKEDNLKTEEKSEFLSEETSDKNGMEDENAVKASDLDKTENTSKEEEDYNEAVSNDNSNKDSSSNSSIKTGRNSNEALKKYWLQIDDVSKCAQDYYTEYFAKTRLISKNGLFYNMAVEQEIDVRYLIENEGLNSKNITATCFILLIYGSDLEKYQGINVAESDKGLSVFVSIKNPLGDGYLIGSQKSEGGILSAKDYISLLGSYSQNHGTIRTLYPDSETYNKIMNFISIYESKFDQYFVRSIVSDDKYALVTFSPQTNTSEVHQYILVNENGFWEVLMTGIEAEPRTIIAINKKIPDFNFNMLPKYTIYDYRNKLSVNFNSIYSVLISNGYISSESEIKYAAGTDNFTFAVTDKEKKFLFIMKNGSWELNEVSSSMEAIKLMEEINGLAPTFIVWDR